MTPLEAPGGGTGLGQGHTAATHGSAAQGQADLATLPEHHPLRRLEEGMNARHASTTTVVRILVSYMQVRPPAGATLGSMV